MSKANVFAQITKVDEEKRLVFGRAAQSVPDKSGEILDYSGSKPYFEAWSANVKKDSGGKSLGNVRSMHSNVAAGKVVQMDFDDGAQAIDVCAKIVDDNEWRKVLEGVHTGFSIGGSYVSRTEKMDGKDKLVSYVADPNEISLVDRPCIPTALFFDVVKGDQVLRKVAFANNEGKEEEKEEAPAADDKKDSKAPPKAEGEKDPEADAENKDKAKGKFVPGADKGKEKDAKESAPDEKAKPKDEPAPKEDKKAADPAGDLKKKDDAEEVLYEVQGTDEEVAHMQKIMLENKLSVGGVVKVLEQHLENEQTAAEAKTKQVLFGKGMYQVSSMARIVDDMKYLHEACCFEEQMEGDSKSDMPVKMAAALKTLALLLVDLVQEEVMELVADEGVMALSDKPGELLKLYLEKAGARNSAADTERIRKIRAAAKTLMALCDELGVAEEEEKKDEPAKAEGGGDLKKMIEDAVNPLQKKLAEVSAELTLLKNSPAPSRVVLRAVGKADDVNEGLSKKEEAPVVKFGDEVQEVASLIKGVHQRGGRFII